MTDTKKRGRPNAPWTSKTVNVPIPLLEKIKADILAWKASFKRETVE